jgi:hypothetical protein
VARLPVVCAVALALVAVLALPASLHAGGTDFCSGVSASAANNQVGYTFTCPEEPYSAGPYTITADRPITAFTNPRNFTCTQPSADAVSCTMASGTTSSRWSGGLTFQGGAGCGTTNRVTLDVTDTQDQITGLTQPCAPTVSKVSPSTGTFRRRSCFTITVVNGTSKLSGAIVSIPTVAKGRTSSKGTVRLCGTMPRASAGTVPDGPFQDCYGGPGEDTCQLAINVYKAGYGSGQGTVNLTS